MTPLVHHVVYDIETISGVQRSVEELLLGLPAGRFRHAGLTNNERVKRTFEQSGWPCLCEPIDRYRARNYPGLLRRLAADHGSPDLLHLHGLVCGLWGPRGARRVHGPLPLLHTPNSLAFKKRWLRPLFVRLWRRALLRCGGQIVATAPSEREEMIALGLPPVLIHLVPNGIRLETLPGPEQREVARARLELAPRARVAGMIGRLHYQKDPLTFVRAALRLAPHYPDLHFVIVGGGALEPELRAAGAPLGDRLRLAGWRDDGVLLCRAFDVAVNCSRYEGQSMALLELLGMGLPVVATTCTGNRDVVTHETGVPVPPGDPAALAEGIASLLDDPARAAALGQAARERVARDHGARAMAEATGALYERILRAGATS